MFLLFFLILMVCFFKDKIFIWVMFKVILKARQVGLSPRDLTTDDIIKESQA